MYFSNIARHGLINFSQSHSNALTFSKSNGIQEDLNYCYFVNDLFLAKQKRIVDYEFGQSWFYYPILTFIPRIIWKDKPPTSFSTRYTEKLYWKLGAGPVVTFTILGEGYLQFGLFGVLLAPILFIFLRYSSMNYLKQIENSNIFILLIIFSMITYFRGEQPIVYVLLDYIYGFIIMKYLSHNINVN